MADVRPSMNTLMTQLVTVLWITWHRLAVLGGRW